MITPKQRALYDFIDAYFREHGYAPTVREMRAGINAKSNSQVHGLLQRLVDRGFLKSAGYGRARGYFVQKWLRDKEAA